MRSASRSSSLRPQSGVRAAPRHRAGSRSTMPNLVVAVPPPYLKMIDHGVVAGERASYLTSVSYQMALVAFHPDATIDVRQTPESVPAEIRDFMAKISVRADEDLLRHYPKSWPARVAVTTASARHEKLVLHVPA